MTDPLAIVAFVISVVSFVLSTLWQPFATNRSEQVKLALSMRRLYIDDYQKHLATIYAFKSSAEHAQPHRVYYVQWLDDMNSTQPDVRERAQQVDDARRSLNVFWDEVAYNYETGVLPTAVSWLGKLLRWGPLWAPKDMMSGNFLRKGVDYRKLVEPLDCANWYRLRNDLQTVDGTPDSASKGDYSQHMRWRPNPYKFIDGRQKAEAKGRQKVTAWGGKLANMATACRDARDQDVKEPRGEAAV